MPQYFGQLPVNEPGWSAIAGIDTVETRDRTLILTAGPSQIRISILAANLVRVRVSPSGPWLPRRSWAVATADDEWAVVPFELKETDATVEIHTDQMTLTVHRQPYRIEARDRSGRPFACDAEPGTAWRKGSVANWKRIEPDEHFYGFGERTRLLDKRNEVITNWTVDALDYGSLTDEMYQAIPFLLSLQPDLCYGVFFNTTFWSQFDLGAAQPDFWQMTTHAPELDYYLMYGPTPAQVVQTYTELTGRMPMPPKWALGYHQCRWSYESEAVVRELAQEFRQRHIPCDVIHLDIDYMEGYRVFTWSPKRFQGPTQLLKDLQQDGFKVVTIVDPGVKYEPEADYPVFDQGIALDYFVRQADGTLFHGYVWPDKAVFPDFLRPEVRQWWGECQQSLLDAGVVGIWNDMNEPAIDDRPFGDGGNKITFPLDAPQGPAEEPSNHAETHNLYGLMMARASYEGLRQARSHERSFVLTRSGYAGIQRWSSVWMGDNQSLWEHLELSLPMLCNMGLSGVAFVGCDIGGFAGNASPELFARWMQVGLLYPLMRAHSALTTMRHEPWVFGDRVEQICRQYIELRYQLLPYLYSLFWEAATTGAPILRPLLYHYPQDPKTYHLHDQVLLGESVLAAPVYRPGVECRAVYLPDGVWYDWWTGDRYEGPTHILAEAPLETLPLYVKAGAILPMQSVVQWIDAQPLTALTLRVYPGTGTYTLYEDDGLTFDYESGAWATTQYSITPDAGSYRVEVAARQGQWSPPRRTVTVELVGVGQQVFEDDGTAQHLRFG